MYFHLIFTFLAAVSGELINVQFEQNPQNYFDGTVKSFSKNYAREHIFGFNEEKACMLFKYGQKWKMYTEKFTTLERSEIFILAFPENDDNILPAICFEHNGHTYLIFKSNFTGQVFISREQNLKIISNFKFDNLKYDHQSKRLFLISNSIISEIELSYLEQFWLEQTTKDHSILKTYFISELEKNTTDFTFFDNHMYYILNGNVYKKQIGLNKNAIFIRKSNALVFNYLLYKHKETINLSKTPPILLYFLYLINTILIFIIAYVLKKAKILKRNGSSIDLSEYFDTVPPPIVMQSLTGYNSESGDQHPYKPRPQV